MRALFLSLVLTLTVTACATGTETYDILVPPPGTNVSADPPNDDVKQCLVEAEFPRALTLEESTLIAGKPVHLLFVWGRPAVTPEGNPVIAPWTLRPAPVDYASRYAVCLRKRGYTWGIYTFK